MSNVSLILAFTLIISASSTEAYGQQKLFPRLNPFDSGYAQTSSVHKIYWERSGTKGATPLVILHGGPGGKISTTMRRLFDPGLFDIIQFDQRGTGKSEPFLETKENNTDNLCSDINLLLDQLQVKSKVIVFGLSWGSTLGLVYAEKYPQKVAGLIISGIFLCDQESINHFYSGVYKFYPENVNRLHSTLNKNAKNIPLELYKVLTNANNKAAADSVRKTFTIYESWMESVESTYESVAKDTLDKKSYSISLLENYYLGNNCFFPEGYIIKNIQKLKDIPVYIANGRLDMLTPPYIAFELNKKLQNSKLDIVDGAGHGDIKVAFSVMKGADWIIKEIKK